MQLFNTDVTMFFFIFFHSKNMKIDPRKLLIICTNLFSVLAKLRLKTEILYHQKPLKCRTRYLDWASEGMYLSKDLSYKA